MVPDDYTARMAFSLIPPSLLPPPPHHVVVCALQDPTPFPSHLPNSTPPLLFVHSIPPGFLTVCFNLFMAKKDEPLLA